MLAPRVLALLACSYFGLVSAVDQLSLEGIPSCAIKCTLQALPETNCPTADQACLCTDSKFAAAVEPCIRSQCSVKESLAATNASYSQCGISSPDVTPKINWVCGVVTVCIIVFMAMRLTTKAAKMSTWGPDDTLATVAFVMIITLYGSSFYFISIGLGKEVWTLHDDEITTFFKLFLFLEWMYLGGLAVIKASILFFYLKIFPDRRFRRVLWTVQIINLLVCLTFIIVCLAQCRPFSYFWTSWDGEHEGTCLDLTWIGLTHVGMNIALDIVMLVLPVTQIYKLNMDTRKKIGVIAMFQAGIFLTVVSILRIRTLSKFALTANITADSVDVFLWAYVEMGVGLVVACMPSAWQLLKLIPSKVTQLTTAVVTNIGSSDNRTRPDSHVVPGKRSKMSVMETHSRRSNSIAMRPASSSKRLSEHDELKVGMAL